MTRLTMHTLAAATGWMSSLAPVILAFALAGTTVAAAQARGGAGARPAAPPSAATTTSGDSVQQGAPVVIGRDTVLFVRARLGSFSPEDRAAAVARRLELLAHTGADTVSQVPAETSTDLVAGGATLMAVTEADALAAGVTRAELSAQHAAALQAALRRLSPEVVLRDILLGVLKLVLATLAFAILAWLAVRGSGRLTTAISSRGPSGLPALRFQRLELLSSARAADVLTSTVLLLRAAAIITLGFAYLTLALSFFPWTEPWSGRIVGYALDPLRRMGLGLLQYLPNIFFIAVTLLVTRYVLRLIRLLFRAIEHGHLVFGNFDRDWAEPTYKIVRFMVLAFAAVVIFPYLPGANSDAFKGVSIFLGLLISLGSSSAIANVIAGVVLTYTRAFRIGDRIQIGEAVGDVVSRSLLVTRLRTIKNVDITIPNAIVLASHIQNFSAMARGGGLILHTGITIGYDAPWRKVEQLLVASARGVEGAVAKPEPFVLQTRLDDFYVHYELNVYTDRPEAMARTYSLLHASIRDRFDEAGVEIMSPHYGALRDGNATTIPAAHLPPGYRPPAFRVDPGSGPG